jgi:predicted transcriptional regulator
MSSSVTPATLDYLARRLDELAAGFPTSPDAVDLVTLTDDIGVLAHHLQHAIEYAQERFTTPQTVYPPERATLVRLARAAAGITRALDTLAEALTYATTGFQRETVEDLAHSPLRNDPKVLRIMTAEKYVAARACLRHTAAALRATSTPAPAGPSTPRTTGPRTQPAAAPQPRQPNRH